MRFKSLKFYRKSIKRRLKFYLWDMRKNMSKYNKMFNDKVHSTAIIWMIAMLIIATGFLMNPSKIETKQLQTNAQFVIEKDSN